MLILASISTTISNGQLTKKNWMVGGLGNFTSSKQTLQNSTDKITSTSLSVSPSIGYFFYDKLATGLTPSVSFNQAKTNSVKSNVTSYKFAPFARYYLLHKERLSNLFLQANLAYGINRFKNFGNSVSKSESLTYSLLAGPVIYFNSTVGLEFALGWKLEKSIDDKSRLSSFIVGVGFQIHLEK